MKRGACLVHLRRFKAKPRVDSIHKALELIDIKAFQYKIHIKTAHELVMTSRRIPTRAKTTPIETLHSLLTLQEAESAMRRQPSNSILINYDELPAWQQNNQFILAHYRPTSHSFFTSFQSLFHLHNESVNIHSHLFGAWIFFSIALSLYAFERHLLTWVDSVAFLIFFSSAVVCLGMSATYHTVSNHSPKVRRVLTKICFILLKITGQSMGEPNGLHGHHHSHFWKLRPERLLWLLLRANATKILLGDGTFELNLGTVKNHP